MKPIYQYFFRGLITFLPVALTVWVLVICMTISMSPPVGTLPLVVIVTSLFLAAIVPVIAMSTVWPLAVQVPATSILPPATN